MKKNLLSVLILVLMLVNIVMSVVIMTSVTNTNKKTAALMDSIGLAMNLELYTPGDSSAVALSDSTTYNLGTRTVLLAPTQAEDGTTGKGKDVYLQFSISLLINTKDDDYAKYGEGDLSGYETRIEAAIEQVVGSHTEEECRLYFTSDIRDEILKAIQNLFGSDFIYSITISDVKYG